MSHKPFRLLNSDDPEEIKLACEILAAVGIFISEKIIGTRDDFIPPPPTIAARILVLLCLLNRSNGNTLSRYGKHIGFTPAAMSKIASRYSDELGIRAAWQRPKSREKLSTIATDRHAGKHIATRQTTTRRQRDAMTKALAERALLADRALAGASLAHRNLGPSLTRVA